MKNIIIRNSNRFKSVFVSVNLLLPLRADETSKNALLAMVLKKNNGLYKKEIELERTLARLYNTTIGVSVEKVDNIYNISFGAEMLNVKYLTKQGVNEVIDIIYNIIKNPNFIHGTFDKETFELEKLSLIQKIAEERDDKKKYALNGLEKEMFVGTEYGSASLGTIEQVEKITNEELVEHYNKVMKEAEIKVIAVGNLHDMEDMPYELHNKICGEGGKNHIENVKDVEKEPSDEIQVKIEEQDINQSVLCIGLRFLNMKKEEIYKAMLFNAILGGTPASKLFQNVREKESLAYFSKATYNRHKNVIYMFSGIAPEKYEKAKQVMLEQVEAIKNADITDIEINAAKQSLVSAYREIQDSKASQAKNIFSNAIFFEKEISFEEIIENIEKLTKQDVVEIAAKVKATNIFLLGGKVNA